MFEIRISKQTNIFSKKIQKRFQLYLTKTIFNISTMDIFNPQQCRACFRDTNLENLDKIVLIRRGENEEQIYILSLLVDFTQIEINEDDRLPKFICSFCIEHLVKAYLFKQQCLQAYEYFANAESQALEAQSDPLGINAVESSIIKQEDKVYDVQDSEDENAEIFDPEETTEADSLVCLDDSDREDFQMKEEPPGEEEDISADNSHDTAADSRSYECSHCPQRFTTEKKLSVHLNESHLMQVLIKIP